MLTDTIVAMIDDELNRFWEIRAILLPFLQSIARKQTEPTVTQTKAAPVQRPVIIRLPSRKMRTKRVQAPKPVEQPTALKGAVPNAPVVFHPTASKVKAKPASLPEAHLGSFAALIRAAERELQPEF